jgi:hypothetical protein
MALGANTTSCLAKPRIGTAAVSSACANVGCHQPATGERDIRAPCRRMAMAWFDSTAFCWAAWFGFWVASHSFPIFTQAHDCRCIVRTIINPDWFWHNNWHYRASERLAERGFSSCTGEQHRKHHCFARVHVNISECDCRTCMVNS